VFFDVEHIVPGDDWRQRLDSALEACDTLIVVMGLDWVATPAEKGKRRRRIDDPDDMVSWEVAEALRRGLRVVQALVQGASEVTAKILPPAIAGLAMRQAFPLRHESFAEDVQRLGDHIVASRKTRATLGRDWTSSDLKPWARLSTWAVQSEDEPTFAGGAVAIVHAMELLLRRGGVDVALSAGYIDARARMLERPTFETSEFALLTCVYIASLIGVPVARLWPRTVAPRRTPPRGGWQGFEFDSYSHRWCRADFFRVDGLADAARQLALGRPVICLCWFDYHEGSGDSPFDNEGVLRRAPSLEDRNARAPILIVGYDSLARRFRCMFSNMTNASLQSIFEVPVEVARAALDVQLMWAVDISASSIEAVRPRRRKQASRKRRTPPPKPL
jgi:hypothetical protein